MTISTIFFSREKHKNLSFRVWVPYLRSENLAVKNKISHRRPVPLAEQSTSSEFGPKRRSFGRPNGRSKIRRVTQFSLSLSLSAPRAAILLLFPFFFFFFSSPLHMAFKKPPAHLSQAQLNILAQSIIIIIIFLLQPITNGQYSKPNEYFYFIFFCLF